jgi:hypothetical protein
MKLSTHSGISFTSEILHHVFDGITTITLDQLWLFRRGRVAIARVHYTIRHLPASLTFVDVVRYNPT